MNTNTASGGVTVPIEWTRQSGAAPVPIGSRNRAVVPQAEETSEPRPGRRGRRVLLLVLGAALVLVLGYWGWSWWQHQRSWVKTDNAYVSAHVHHVSARVAGTVQEVDVIENQEVREGALVARLDPRDYQVRLEQARAENAQAAAKNQQARAAVGEFDAKVVKARVQLDKARTDLERARALFEDSTGAISRQEYDDARTAHDAAEAALKEAEAGLGSARASAAAAQAAETASLANLRQSELDLSYVEIAAPAAGRVGRKNLEVGNRVLPGQALVAIVGPDVWLTANYKETQVGGIRAGQVAQVRLDAFPGRVFLGRVDSLSPASGAQFALLPPDNATGNFTRVVQRVPVKIVFDPESVRGWEGLIVPGMSAVVEIKIQG